MPCGLGFHPFLPRSGDARLELEAAQVWNGTADAFPTARMDVPAALDFRAGPRVSEREGTDHCFDGWKRRATVRYGQGSRTLVLDGCEETAYVMVYIPEERRLFLRRAGHPRGECHEPCRTPRPAACGRSSRERRARSR